MSVLNWLGFSQRKLLGVTAVLALIAISGKTSGNAASMLGFLAASGFTLILWRYGTPDADADDDDSWPDDVG